MKKHLRRLKNDEKFGRNEMKRRFTGNELFKLRNSIPIDRLIEDNLKIASKIGEGWFRFLCPICGEFDTAVNPRTNLARCFRCEKNFNPIDLKIMHKEGSAKRRLKKYDNDRYAKTGAIPKPLLLAAKGAFEGRK